MLTKKTISSRALFLLGCALGAAVFFLLFTAAPLDVSNDSWLRTGFVEKDLTQHYTGWLFLRDSALSFPLGMADNINYPYGSAVTFTDSIPLFAIFFRFFNAWLPATFQYFGLFSLLCYMLQGGVAMLLLALFCQKLPALCCGTLLLVCNPVLLERTFRHTALSAQWLILFALYLYFKNKKEGFAFRWGYLVLLGLGVTIHPYFLPMLFGILFADLLEHCLVSKEIAKSCGFLTLSFAVVLGIGGCIGIFSVPASGETLVGYGYFGMNLNTLWTPVSPGGLVWSSVLPTQNQGLGTAEGFNYLGLAVLVAAPLCALHFAIQEKWAGICAALKTHCGLIFVCTCLTIFALSNTWVANIRVLFTIPLPDALQSFCDIFRASGRMFWPVYYLIFLFVIVRVAQVNIALPRLPHEKASKTDADTANATPTCDAAPVQNTAALPCAKTGKAVGCILLALILVVQLTDMRDILAEKRSFFTDPTPTFTCELTDPLWDEIAENYDHLFSLDDCLYGAVDLALYAATNGMTTNDGWSARFDSATHSEDVAAEVEKILAGEFSEGTFYLTCDQTLFAQLAQATIGTTYAVQIDWNWYAILPIVDGITAPTERETLFVYPLLPLTIPDFSDDYFTDGISNDDPSVITLYLNKFSIYYLGPALMIYDEAGNAYEILEYNYNYEGRFIITLDIEDASVLKGQYLCTDYNTTRATHY